MTGRAPQPGPRRLGRAGVAAVVIVGVMIVVIFFGRILWHRSEVHEDPPEIRETQQP